MQILIIIVFTSSRQQYIVFCFVGSNRILFEYWIDKHSIKWPERVVFEIDEIFRFEKFPFRLEWPLISFIITSNVDFYWDLWLIYFHFNIPLNCTKIDNDDFEALICQPKLKFRWLCYFFDVDASFSSAYAIRNCLQKMKETNTLLMNLNKNENELPLLLNKLPLNIWYMELFQMLLFPIFWNSYYSSYSYICTRFPN